MIVDLLPTDDQAMIADTVDGLVSDRLPLARFRDPAAAGGGAERAAWRDLAELGLFGLGVPAADGGVGYGIAEEVTVGEIWAGCWFRRRCWRRWWRRMSARPAALPTGRRAPPSPIR